MSKAIFYGINKLLRYGKFCCAITPQAELCLYHGKRRAVRFFSLQIKENSKELGCADALFFFGAKDRLWRNMTRIASGAVREFAGSVLAVPFVVCEEHKRFEIQYEGGAVFVSYDVISRAQAILLVCQAEGLD